MDDCVCKKCLRPIKSLPHHLSKNPDCKSAYNLEELEKEKKERRKLYLKDYNEKHSDTIAFQKKTYVKRKSEETSKRKADYFNINREEILQKKAKRDAENTERTSQYNKDYYKEHSEEKKANYQERKDDNKEKAAAYYQMNKEKYAAKYQTNKEEVAEDYQKKKEQIAAKYQINKETIAKKYQENRESKLQKQLIYDKAKVEKKKTEYTEWDRLRDFKNSIKFGPIYPCVSCERLLYFEGVVKIAYPERYDELKVELKENKHENLIKCILIKDEKFVVNGNVHFCHTCHTSIFKKHTIPTLCHINGLDLTEVPDGLKLSRCESVLISKAILFLQIHQLPKSRWPALKDKIICVLLTDNDLQRTVEKLPRLPEEGGLILLDFKRKECYTSSVYKELVRPDAIVTGVKILKEINPHYKNVKIAEAPDYINQCKENDHRGYMAYMNENVSEDQDLDNEPEDDMKNVIDDASEDENEGEVEEGKDSIKDNQFQISNVTMLMNEHIENEVFVNESSEEKSTKQRSDSGCSVKLAPGEGKIPTDLMREKHWDVKAFPTKHPDGKFGFDHEREKKLTPQQYFCQRVLNRDDRFSSDPMFVFAAYYFVLRYQLESRINISYQRGTIKSNGEITNMQDAFSVFDKIPGTFKYWKQARMELVAALEQNGPFHFFFTLSCADKRWKENFASILSTLGHEIEYTEEFELLVDGEPLDSFLENENIHEMMKDNVVTITRNFNHRVNMFRKHVMFGHNNPLRAKYFNHRVEFQNRGAAHIHGVVWMDLETQEKEFPGIQDCFNKLRDGSHLSSQECEVLTAVIDKFVSCSLKEESVSHIVKQVQVHHHTKSCRNDGSDCRFDFPRYPSNKTIIAQPLIDCNEEEKKKKVAKFQAILKKVKNALSCLDDTSFSSIEEFLMSIKIDEEEYYQALSVSANGVAIILKRDIDEIFVNQYNTEWLRAWDGNIDFQLCLNYFEIVTYITDYYMKSETALVDVLVETAKELKDQNLHEKMRTVIQVFLKHRQISLAEALYCLDSSMHLKDSNVKCTYVGTGFPSTRSRFLSKIIKELEKAEENFLFIPGRDARYKPKLAIHDKYSSRPQTLEEICLAQFSMMYETTNAKFMKSVDWTNNCNGLSKTRIVTWQGEKDFLPQRIQLSDGHGYMICRREPYIMRIHKINKNSEVHEYMYSELLLFCPWWNESELHEKDFEKCYDLFMESESDDATKSKVEIVKSSLFPHLNNVQEGRAKVEEATVKRNLHIGDALNALSQQENYDDEDEGTVIHNEFEMLADSWNEFADADEGCPSETRITYDKYVQKVSILDKDELCKNARQLSSDQRHVFDIVIKYCKDIVKSRKIHIKSPAPINLLIHGGAGSGKSTIISTITPWIQSILQHEGDNPSCPYVVKMAPTGLAALNIEGMTIHSGLNIAVFGSKHRSLSDKIREELRHQLQNLRILILDECSMIKSDLLYQIHLRLQEIKRSEDVFGGVSVLLFGDLMQLKPPGGKFIFEQPGHSDYKAAFIADPLWKKFQVVELKENHRQGEDKTYAELLNRIRFGNHTLDDVEILKSAVVEEIEYHNSENMNLFGTNMKVNECNDKILNTLSEELITVKAKVIHPTDPFYLPPINKKTLTVSDTNLLDKLNLKIGARVMLTINVYTKDGLVNGACGVVHGFIQNNLQQPHLILIQFDDENVGQLTRQKNENAAFKETQITPIKKQEQSFSIGKMKKQHSFRCRVIQFPLRLAWASTIHKVQGQTIQKPKTLSVEFESIFDPAMAYVALSRIQALTQLRIINFDSEKIECFASAKACATELKDKALNLNPCEWKVDNNNKLKVTNLNIVSLRKHLEDLKRDDIIMQSDVILLTETSISPNDVEDKSIHGYKLIVSDARKGRGVACYIRDSLNVQKIDCDNSLGFQIIYIWLPDLLIINIYKTHIPYSNRLLTKAITQYMEGVQVDTLMMGDFNVPFKDNSSNILLKGLENLGFNQLAAKPTHICGNILDHVYISFSKKKVEYQNVHAVYYSDHCANCVIIGDA